jgi:serine/threonine protein kinase
LWRIAGPRMDGLQPLLKSLESGEVSLSDCLSSHPEMPSDQQLVLVLADQRVRLARGLPADVSYYGKVLPWLAADSESRRKLVLAEFERRLGSAPSSKLQQQFLDRYREEDLHLDEGLEALCYRWNEQPMDDDAFDLLCDQFEEELQAGNAPKIGEWIDRVPEVSRGKVFRELLQIDLHYHGQTEESIPWDRYLRSYPQHLKTIKELQRRENSVESSEDETYSSNKKRKKGACSIERNPRYQVGQKVAGFRLIKEIGSGGFGQVFAGEDLQLGRKVALKFPKAKLLEKPDAIKLFLQEARSLATVANDHVVPILQVGNEAEQPFFVMPLLAGETLQSKLERDGILPLDEFLRVAKEICSGLAAIHAKGLVHRDLKPANIWLDADTRRVRILDLGLADSVTELQNGVRVGTPAYMSPEQVEGEAIDFRSDIFSAGAVFYECLAAKRAFAGKCSDDVIEAIRRKEPFPLEKANPATLREISVIITKMLDKNRAKRQNSVEEIHDALGNLASHAFAEPKAGSYLPNRTPRLPTISVCLLALMVTGLLLFPSNSGDKSPKKETGPDERVGNSLNDSIRIESLDVTPILVRSDGVGIDLPNLSENFRGPLTTNHAIVVSAELSRPGYGYIVLYRSDGSQKLLYPYEENERPHKEINFRYPSAGNETVYQLNEGPGVWAIAIIATDTPLPSYREWTSSHKPAPWTRQEDSSRLDGVVIDDSGIMIAKGKGIASRRRIRGEVQLNRLPTKALVDYWRNEADATVKLLAFPVIANQFAEDR